MYACIYVCIYGAYIRVYICICMYESQYTKGKNKVNFSIFPAKSYLLLLFAVLEATCWRLWHNVCIFVSMKH